LAGEVKTLHHSVFILTMHSVMSRKHVLKAGVSRLLWAPVRKAVNLCGEGGLLACDLVNNISLVAGMLQVLSTSEDDRFLYMVGRMTTGIHFGL